jgi:hypothetical protein
MNIEFSKKRLCRAPTVWGWLVLCTIFFGFCFFSVNNLNSFLSLNKPLDAKVMVMEGWLPTTVLTKAAQEFRTKNYSMIFVTGIAIDRGEFYWQEKTYADMGAASLRHIGLDSHVVVAIAAPQVKMDRTFASACALRRFLDSTGQRVSEVNVVSLGPHSRRSRLLFQQALGKRIKVGIFSYPDETYDPKTWWASSNGFKAIVDETVSYCYTKFVFCFKKSNCL